MTGAQVILNLRIVVLSGVWKETYRQILTTYRDREIQTPGDELTEPTLMAA